MVALSLVSKCKLVHGGLELDLLDGHLVVLALAARGCALAVPQAMRARLYCSRRVDGVWFLSPQHHHGIDSLRFARRSVSRLAA